MATFGHAFTTWKQHLNPLKMWQKSSNFCPNFIAEGLFDVVEVEFGAR